MSRLSSLNENKLVDVIASLQRDYNELKNRQLTSGTSGVKGYMAENPVTWDYEATITIPPGFYTNVNFRIEFTGDGTQRYPIVTPYMDIQVDGIDLERNENGQMQYVNGSDLLDVTAEFTPQLDTVANPLTTAWIYSLGCMGTLDIKLKVRVVGTSRGTLTVVLV